MKRNRRQENTETTLPPPTLQEALNENVDSTIFDKFNDLVIQYGSDLILRVYSVKSDNRSLGFIDEILTPEIDVFLQNPEIFLRDRFGTGVFRITVVSNATKKFITNLTISISAPKSTNSNPPVGLEDINKARREARSEVLEIANLVKTSQPQTQTNQDQIKVFETLYKIQAENNKMVVDLINSSKQRELDLIEKFTSKQTDINKQLEPVLKAVSSIGEAFSSAMDIVTEAIQTARDLTPPEGNPSIVSQIKEVFALISNNPALINGLLSAPKVPLTPNLRNEIPIIPNLQTTEKTHNQSETKTPPLNTRNTPPITAEQLFFTTLITRLEKWFTLDDPETCASDILSDLEYLEAKEAISKEQFQHLSTYLVSNDLLEHLKNSIPNFTPYEPFLKEVQKEYMKLLNEPEETPEATRQ